MKNTYYCDICKMPCESLRALCAHKRSREHAYVVAHSKAMTALEEIIHNTRDKTHHDRFN